MNRYFKLTVIIILLILSNFKLDAQMNTTPYNVSDDIVLELESKMQSKYGAKFYLTRVFIMDSLFAKVPITNYDPKYKDPYGNLSGKLIFSLQYSSENNHNSFDSSIVGVYSDGVVLWDSGPIIYGNVDNRLIFCDDINIDGLVDIGLIAEQFEARYYNPNSTIYYLWILSWDGTNGRFINDYDIFSGKSSLVPGQFKLFDWEGDGILEISSRWFFNDEYDYEDPINPPINYPYVTYGWDGNKYGYWSSIYQLKKGDYYPATWIKPGLDCKVTTRNDSLVFNYSISNGPESEQAINNVYITGIDVSNIGESSKLNNDILSWPNGIIDNSWVFASRSFTSLIKPGERRSDNSYTGEGIPGLCNAYIQGQIPVELTRDGTYESEAEGILENSIKKITIGLKDFPTTTDPLVLIDSLVSYTTQSFDLYWIEDEKAYNKFMDKLEKAKESLSNGNSRQTIEELNHLLKDVEKENGKKLTSEAYALLYYNTEYLIEQLPAVELKIESMSPTITITKPKKLTLTVYGSNFSKKSEVYFNGKKQKTKFISENQLEAEIKDKDIKKEGTYSVHVAEKKIGRTEELEFNVYKELPERLVPVLNCVEDLDGKKSLAWFGYENYNDGTVFIDGKENEIKGGKKKDKEAPTVIFLPGVHEKVFSVEFDDKKKLKWLLLKEKAEVTEDTPLCQ